MITIMAIWRKHACVDDCATPGHMSEKTTRHRAREISTTRLTRLRLVCDRLKAQKESQANT